MISVFPDRMNRTDPEDSEESIRTIDTYIRYMVEQIEFALTNSYRTVNGLGVTGEELALLLTQTRNDLSALSSTVADVAADVLGKVDKVEGKGLSTEDYTTEEKEKLASFSDDLEDRVEDLEAVITQSGPILIQNAEDVTAAEGDDAIFSVRALGTNLTYKWELYYSSSWTYPNFQGRDTPNMTVPATASRNLYRFRCTITGGGWTIYSKTVTLHVTS